MYVCEVQRESGKVVCLPAQFMINISYVCIIHFCIAYDQINLNQFLQFSANLI